MDVAGGTTAEDITWLPVDGEEADEDSELQPIKEGALSAGAAVLVLTRFTTSTAGHPLEVSIMTMTRHLQYRQRKQAS